MKRTAAMLVFGTAIPLAACGARVSSASFIEAAPKPPEHEIRLYSTKLPTCPYEEVGLVRSQRGEFGSLDGALEALMRRARQMGGDAVVGLGQGVSVAGGTAIGDISTVSSQEVLAGTVIRFTDAGCVP